MKLSELITKLEYLAEQYGGAIEVMINHEQIAEVNHVEPCDGCPQYISLEEE